MVHGPCGISLRKAEPLSFWLPPLSYAVLSMIASEYVNTFPLNSEGKRALGQNSVVALSF